MYFTPEDQFLAQCSRVKMSDPRAANLLQGDLDWNYLLQAAILHGVAPLFYHGLTQLAQAPQFVPQAAWRELEWLYQNNCRRNRRLYHVVGEVYKAFEQASIPAIGLKDLPLARTVYPDVGLRPIGDVDILIHQEDFARAQGCLAGLGFSPLPSPDSPHILKYAWAIHFHRPADNVWLDVQWGVLQLEWDVYGEGNFDFDLDRMWRGARSLVIDDYQILEPRPEDMLFHLCMHLEGHRYAELILFCDIAEFVRHYGPALDWDYLIDISRQYGVETSIYYTLLFTQKLFDCDLSTPLQKLQPDYFRANLFGPLFGNSNDLHGALDDIHRIAAPPPEVMTQFERAVRTQAVYAMRWYQELDSLAAALRERGAEPLIFEGDSSQMIFPSPALPSFPPVRLLTLKRHHARLDQALTTREFERALQPQSCTKRRSFTSRDPVVGQAPLTLEASLRVIEDLGSLLNPAAQPARSKKNLALKALEGAGKQTPNSVVSPRLDLYLLSPEESVLYLAARLGQSQFERLFGLCSLLEFFRGYQDPLDWQQVADLAKQHGLKGQVYAGLLLVNPFLNRPISPDDLARFQCSDPPPRLLAWARYGPAALDRHTHFKELFFCAFSLLSTQGFKAKLKYLFGLPCRQGRRRAWLICTQHALSLGWTLLAGLFQGKKPYTARDFAYWTEPESTDVDETRCP